MLSVSVSAAGDDLFVPPVAQTGERAIESFAGDADALGEQLRALRQHINTLELDFARGAARLAALFAQDPKRIHENPAHWLRDNCGMTTYAAAAAIDVGEHEAELPNAIDSLLDGRIGMPALGYMAETASRLATSSTATGAFDETRLLALAEKLTPNRFRRQCQSFIHETDHAAFVGGEVFDATHRTLRLITNDMGCVRIEGEFDAEGSAIIRAALDPFARKTGPDDNRSVARRRGDALVEVLNHLLDDGRVPRHDGQRPHLHVTTTLETLLDVVGAPAAEMETGAMLSGAAIQRLACDSTMIRVLCNSKSEVIDVGRAQRVVPPATRRALNARDKGCVWPGCDRGTSWTQAHHLLHWAVNGPTNRDNLVLLCHRHHWMVHEGGFVIVRTDDGRILTFAPERPLPAHARDPCYDVA